MCMAAYTLTPYVCPPLYYEPVSIPFTAAPAMYGAVLTYEHESFCVVMHAGMLLGVLPSVVCNVINLWLQVYTSKELCL